MGRGMRAATVMSLTVAVLLALTTAARADEVLLKNGNLIQGEIVKVDDKQVSLKVPYEDKETGEVNNIEMTIDLSTVKSLTRTATLFQKTERTRPVTETPAPAATGAGTAPGQTGAPGEAGKINWDYRTDAPPQVLQQWSGSAAQVAELELYVKYLEQELSKLIAEKRELKKQLDDVQGGAIDDPMLKDDNAMLELDLLRYYDRDVWNSATGKELATKVEEIARRKLLVYKWLEQCQGRVKEAKARLGTAK